MKLSPYITIEKYKTTLYNCTMIITLDFILQIVAISTSLGALLVLLFLLYRIRSKKLILCTYMVLSFTVNYFIGIISYALIIKSTANLLYFLFASIQLISILAMIEFSRTVIESLDTKRKPLFKTVSRTLYLIPIAIVFIPGLSAGVLSGHLSDISILLLGILNWIYLYYARPEKPLFSRVRKTALIGYGIIIPGYIIQSIIPIRISIHPMDALSFLFTTFSALLFSIYYLTSNKEQNSEVVSSLDIQNQYSLTERETEVLNLLIDSTSYKEIAVTLGISMATVKTHVSKVYKKTETKGRSEVKFRFSHIKN